MDFQLSISGIKSRFFSGSLLVFNLPLYGWDFSNRNQSSVNLKNPCLMLSRRAKNKN